MSDDEPYLGTRLDHAGELQALGSAKVEASRAMLAELADVIERTTAAVRSADAGTSWSDGEVAAMFVDRGVAELACRLAAGCRALHAALAAQNELALRRRCATLGIPPPAEADRPHDGEGPGGDPN